MIEPQLRDNIIYSELDSEKDREFKVKLSPKAFHILSTQLYKHKIRAIIRELSCNAVDAHVAAGHTEPFEVTLPNSFLPIFSIRDYGTGICEEDMYDVFTVLFESTKEHSNDFTGMLGLGSKTPFAYTESFTVTSFQNGLKKTYIALMGNNRVPSLNKVDVSETDEGNGLQIQFAVSPSDFSEFYNEARYVFKSFLKIKPIIKGQNISVDDLQKHFVFLDHDLFIDKSTSYSYGRYVIQGNIAYSISNFDVVKEFFAKYNLKSDVYIIAPIGSLTFTPNREELDSTESNKKALENLFKNIGVSEIVQAEVDKRLATVTSQYEACLLYNEIHGWYKNSNEKNYNFIFSEEIYAQRVKDMGFDFCRGLSLTDAYGPAQPYLQFLEYDVLSFHKVAEPGQKWKLYIREDFRGSLKYIKHDLDMTHSRGLVIKTPVPFISKKDGKLIEREGYLEEFLDKYRDFFTEIVKSSDLKDKYKNDLNRKKEKFSIFKTDTYDSEYSPIEDFKLSQEDSFYYLIHSKYLLRTTVLYNAYFNFLTNSSKITGFEDIKRFPDQNMIFIVRKSDLNTLRKNFPNAINLEDLVFNRVFKVYKPREIKLFYERIELQHHLNSNTEKQFGYLNKYSPDGFEYPYKKEIESIFRKDYAGDFSKLRLSFPIEYFDNICMGRLRSNEFDISLKRKVERIHQIHQWYTTKIPMFFLSVDGIKHVGIPNGLTQQFKENFKNLLDANF